jgi:hypothetical protein
MLKNLQYKYITFKRGNGKIYICTPNFRNYTEFYCTVFVYLNYFCTCAEYITANFLLQLSICSNFKFKVHIVVFCIITCSKLFYKPYRYSNNAISFFFRSPGTEPVSIAGISPGIKWPRRLYLSWYSTYALVYVSACLNTCWGGGGGEKEVSLGFA